MDHQAFILKSQGLEALTYFPDRKFGVICDWILKGKTFLICSEET